MSTTKRERDVIRITSKREPIREKRDRLPKEYNEGPSLNDAMEEWAQDYAGEHSVFED